MVNVSSLCPLTEVCRNDDHVLKSSSAFSFGFRHSLDSGQDLKHSTTWGITKVLQLGVSS